MERLKKYQCLLAEMSYTRDQIQKEVWSSNRTRGQHLILCYLISKNNAVNHWQTEIQADLKDIADKRWTANKKYLPQKEYFKHLWEDPYENADDYEIINKWIEDLIYDKYPIPKDWETKKKDLVNSLKNFYYEASFLISEGKLTKQSIYNLIEKHIIKK